MRLLTAFYLLCGLASAQDFTDYNIEKVFGSYRFAEGPAWSPDHFMVFTDVPANHIIRWIPGGKPEVVRDQSQGASGLAFDALGRLYICETRARRVIRLDKKNKVEVLADKWEGKRLNAPNDIAVRKDGNAWFTDPAFGAQADTRELDFYGIYHFTPKGDLELLAKSKGRPNGIALSAGGKILYVADSDQHKILAWDIDKLGAASNERVAVEGIDGVPNGIRVDENGNIYVAARKVAIYSPQGKLLHSLEFSEKPSNLCFGEADFATLYITARTSVYRVRLNVKGAAQ